MKEVPCPRCQSVMSCSEDGTAPVWSCSKCQLKWIPRRSLVHSLGENSLIRIRERKASDSKDSLRELICPGCETATFRVMRFGEVEIDQCQYCEGLVLDPGEILKYLKFEIEAEPSMTPLQVISGGFDILVGLGEFLSLFR